MSATQRHETVESSWRQLEDFVEQLHERARAPIEMSGFYRQLLEGCITTLAATGGAVWLQDARGRLELLYSVNLKQAVNPDDSTAVATHQARLQDCAAAAEPRIFLQHGDGSTTSENPADTVLLVGPVLEACATKDEPSQPGQPRAIVELFLRAGSSPAVQQGWREFLSTVCHVAADFHALDEIRALRSERDLHAQSLALLRRVHGVADLRRTAFEIANEGRRHVNSDRLSVLLRRGQSWSLLATSGVDRVEPRADTAKRLQTLAELAASWGEPIDYADSRLDEQLPPELAELIERYIDQSHARRLVVVPIEFAEDTGEPYPRPASHGLPSVVLVAEQFDAAESELSRQRVVELAQLCEPVLRQARRLDRFPLRTCLRWADRWSRLRETWGLGRFGLAISAVAVVLAALVLVPCDFEIKAPAALAPLVERDVFATTNGRVTEVRVAHGDEVHPGDVLAVLHDSQLSLDVQRIQGEIETVGKRLEAIAVVRTDRNVREDSSQQGLPLSAETQQLEKRLASLQQQREILEGRRESLTLRSPIAGKVLTMDVQNLLRARPVERGQVLFTVADTAAGWQLLADVPQDRIGYVVAAQQNDGKPLPVRFRLAGDVSDIYTGQVESISATAVLDMDNLGEEAPPVQVRVRVHDTALAAARPGMSAQVRIHCGRRSLGYVWLHDAWETVYSWMVF